MSCDERFEKILDLVNGELSWLEQAELEAHIDVCPVCRKRVESLKALETCVTRAVRRPSPSSDPTADIMARLAEQTKPTKFRWTRTWAIGLAMGLCIGLVVKLWAPIAPTRTPERKNSSAKTVTAEHIREKSHPRSAAIHTASVPSIGGVCPGEKEAARASARRPRRTRRIARADEGRDLAPGTYWAIRSSDGSGCGVDNAGSAVWEIRSAEDSEQQKYAIIVVDTNGNTVGPVRTNPPVPVPERQAKYDTRCEPGPFVTAEDSHHLENDGRNEPAPVVRGARG